MDSKIRRRVILLIIIITTLAIGSLIALAQQKSENVYRIQVSFTFASPDASKRLRDWLKNQDGVSSVMFHGRLESGKLGIRIVQTRSLFDHSILDDVIQHCEAAGFQDPKIIDFDYTI